VQEAALGRRAGAEFVGTAFLTLCIIGSGIAATRLSPGDHGFQLLLNALATGLGLVAIILAIGSVSGGQINPAITLVAWVSGGLAPRDALTYVAAQLAGAAVGAVLANVIFGLRAVEVAQQVRATSGLWAFEVIATIGLVLVVFGLLRSQRSAAVPYAVGAYIGAAILFTSSTSFANPAATLARSLSNTFAGIAPASAAAFVFAELAGALLGLILVRQLYPRPESDSR
jgi:glycerol uptake facilitator-like aquaporin